MDGKMLQQKINQGFGLLESGKHEEAYEFFSGLKKFRNPEVLYGLATSLFKRQTDKNANANQVDEIVKLYERAIERSPSHADAHLMLSQALLLRASLSKSESRNQTFRYLQRAEQELYEAQVYNPQFLWVLRRDLPFIKQKKSRQTL